MERVMAVRTDDGAHVPGGQRCLHRLMAPKLRWHPGRLSSKRVRRALTRRTAFPTVVPRQTYPTRAAIAQS